MTPPTLAEYLEEARSRLHRVAPEDLAAAVAAGAIVVDVRDTAQRHAQGELPGALVIDLTVLEWRLAPSSESRTLDTSDGRQVIVVCSEGYSSSLAAARLQDLGVTGATDLIGGFTEWSRSAASA